MAKPQFAVAARGGKMDLAPLVSWILLGTLAGWIASRVKGRNAPLGASTNIIVGVIGAVIGGWLTAALFGIATMGLNLTTLIGAVVGAVLFLFVVPMVWHPSAANVPESDQEIQPSVLPKNQQEIEKSSFPRASVKKAPSGTIFLSYRRADSEDIAGRNYDRLVQAFGKTAVFKDVDSIPLGSNFKKILEEKVGECNVLLPIIGDRWLTVTDERGRRLEDPNDFVRIEIESALARDVPVIPLLVRGTPIPSQKELPTGLKDLAFRNGMAIRPDPDFHKDMDRLITALEGYVKPKR